MPTPSPLVPAFTIDPTTHLYDIVGATVAGDLTGAALAETRVVFTSNIPVGSVLTYQGNIFRTPLKVYGTVSETGSILRDDGLPVALLANDTGLNVTGIQWTVSILVPTPGSTGPLNPWTFNAPAAGVVENLATTIPVPSVTAVGVTQGPKGDPVDDVKLIDGNLIFYVDEVPVGSPIPVTAISAILDWANVTNKPSTFPPAAASVGPAQLSATGTPSATDFLRGDNTWAQPAASGVTYSNSGTPTDVQSYLSSFTSSVNAALATMQLLSQKGIANGYAGLDASGHIPLSLLPTGSMTYLGTWNASTNTPTVANGTGSAGQVYIVATAGTQNLGAGSQAYSVGDYLVYDGSVWDHIGNFSNTVSSVAGLTGSVISAGSLVAALNLQIGVQVQAYSAALNTIAGLSPSNNDMLQYVSGAWANQTPAQVKATLALAASDVGLGNCNNTSDANKPISTATQTALNAKMASNSDLSAIATANATAANVAMNSKKITGLANGTASTDAAAFGQIPTTTGAALIKGNGSGGFVNATSGTDYAPATSGSGMLKGNGVGGTATATPGTDYSTASATETFTNKTINGANNTLSNIPRTAVQETVLPSSATSLTLTVSNSCYVFTGSAAATWTMPPVSGDGGVYLTLMNRGTATLTVQRAGTDNLYLVNATATSISLAPGSDVTLIDDGTYWMVETTAISTLNASGTPSSSTFLRGDGTWAAGASGQSSTYGAYASMPSATGSGNLYYCTDIDAVFQDTAASTWTRIKFGAGGTNQAMPKSSGWSTVSGSGNTSSIAASLDGYLITAIGMNTSADNLFYHYRTLSPTSNYTATFYIEWQFSVNNGPLGWIGLSDGTKYITFGCQTQSGNTANVLVQHWNSATSINGSQTFGGQAAAAWLTARWWRLLDDGTNLNYQASLNGIDYFTFYKEARTTFLTPTTIGWGINSYSTSAYTWYGRLRALTGVS